jgi:Peptidase S46.
MKKTCLLILLTTILAISPIRAEEGMWLLPLIEKLNIKNMQALGFKLSAQDVYDINNASLKDAIVSIGGCTAEVISSQGLLLTNHHCGYGHIQRLSTVEHDYLKDGYWAMNRQQELPAAGMTATFLDSFTEVTAEVEAAMKSIKKGVSEADHLRTVTNQIAENAIKGKQFMTARVVPMYGGNAYYLVVSKTYTDVRFVGAPPSSIGKYGADTDNWIWPRHTGDFSIFRIYADENNNPAAYSPNNRPYQPKKHLTVSIKGVKENDFAMVIGYPGRTNRFMTSSEVAETRDLNNAIPIYVRGVRQDVLMADMESSPKIRLQYASKYSGSSNFWKKATGMNETFARLNVQDRLANDEKEFAAWVNQSPARIQKYGTAIQTIKDAVEKRADLTYHRLYLSEALSNIELTSLANSYAAYAEAIAKGDKAAADNQLQRLKGRQESFYTNYSLPTDIKVAKTLIKLYKDKVSAANRPSFYATIDSDFNGNIDAFVDDLYSKSIFTDQNKLNNALENNPQSLLNDPALIVGQSIAQKLPPIMAQIAEINKDVAAAQKAYIAGQLEMRPERPMYPDANSTMRMTYGQVLTYNPKDAVTYDYVTTLKGVMEKEDPTNWEFEVPEKLKELYRNKDYGQYAMENGEMPVCFIFNGDITGGNSGSPVLNDKGELIGAAFDGNWEAMSGDIIFEPTYQRCINVDVRYILFIIEKYGNAKHLIDEMTIAR